jgi:tetratricopeptide (TPR) repeat protein
MFRSVKLPAARLAVIFALAVSALALTPAHGESALSGRVSDQLMQLYRLDFNRQLKADFEAKKQALGSAETPERAAKLGAMLKERAKYFESVDDVEKAGDDYDALVEIRPLNPKVYLDRGYFLMRQERFADAEHDFMTGARLVPDEAAFSYGAGRARMRMGDYTGAVTQFGEAIRLAPRDGVARLSRGEAWLKLDKYSEAEADFNRALTLGLGRDDDRFFAYLGRGYAHIQAGDYGNAVRDLDVAVAARPGMVKAVVWRGYARERMGERDRALNDYEIAARISPDDAWIRSSIRRMRS